MGLFGTRKEHSKDHSYTALENVHSPSMAGSRRPSKRIPKLATLFSEGADDGNENHAESGLTAGLDTVAAPTVDMDEFDTEVRNQSEKEHCVAVLTAPYEDDARNFSAISTCGNQRALAKSSSRHDAILKRADSISLMAKRNSIKRSVSRKIARSESRRQSFALNSTKEERDGESHVKKPSSSSSLLPDIKEVDDLVSRMAQTNTSSPRVKRVTCSANIASRAKNLSKDKSTNERDFEAAFGEDDTFMVEEATRNDFATKEATVAEMEKKCEIQQSEGKDLREATVVEIKSPRQVKGKVNEQSSGTEAVDLKRGRSRKRPPPLVAADEGKSSSDPASDWPHTAVFGKDGGFTTGGFKITSEGMVGKPPIATRKDSDPQEDGDAPQSDPNLIVVRSLKEFRAGPTIGAGAAGRVYLAEHLPSEKTMAMKVVNVYDKEKRNQLLKELETLSTHISRYLVRFYGAFYDGSGAVHIALEYMDHGCLSSFVQKVGPIPERVVQMIAIDCLRGLRFLHRHHVLHRDFKTANILLSRRLCCAKLSDFGLARDLNPGVSRVETFVGTVAYMSPERLQGSKYTYASDIWALGVSLVECLLGRYPFNKPQSYFDYIDATMSTNMWAGLRHSGVSVSDLAKDFVAQCTHTDPNRRPDSSRLLEHPWLSDIKKDVETFGSWLDHCRIRSMAVSAKASR